jgi:hypothetical protein
MVSRPTKAQQLKAVGEGLAVGCLMLGHHELPANKMNVELAFQRAWRSWPHAGRFPSVRADLERNHIYWQIIDESARRRPPIIAFWDVGRTLRPQLQDGFSMDDARDLLQEFHDIPTDAWVELARLFTEALLNRQDTHAKRN